MVSEVREVKQCPMCLGDGRVEQEYTVGGYTPDRWMEIRVKMVECEKCGGWGEIENEEDTLVS